MREVALLLSGPLGDCPSLRTVRTIPLVGVWIIYATFFISSDAFHSEGRLITTAIPFTSDQASDCA